MMRRLSVFLLLVTSLAAPVRADEGVIATGWPLIDLRASPSAEYRSLHLLGPLLKHEVKGDETEYALRPLFYRAVDDEGVSRTDVLYPLFGHRQESEASGFHLLHLLHADFGSRESGSRNEAGLFPFLFYGEDPEHGRYAAFFPLHGTLYNKFGRDRISFTLFPLHVRTEKGTTRIDNILWPLFARITGDHESGYKAWPLFGHAEKQGVYSKTFFLWPIFFSESSQLDSDAPEEKRAVWPLYVRQESRYQERLSLLWPFFNHTIDHRHGFERWDAPWPLVSVTRGETHHGLRMLPFYSDETMDVLRRRWYLWPLYKIEEMNTELITRRRDRVLFFLYSDTREAREESGESLRRVAFWPLFGYEREKGVSHLHILALAEPLFPENEAIERLWAPLWRIYQQKWDGYGNQVVSLLWNLFWSERRGERLAWELFPLIDYRREATDSVDLRLLKGLVHYHAEPETHSVTLLWLPWSMSWPACVSANQREEVQ